MNHLEELKRVSKILIDAPTTSAICGGAVRDIDHGVIPKDFDVFATYTDNDQIQPMLDYMQMHFHYHGQFGEHNDYEENLNNIDSVHDFSFLTGERDELLNMPLRYPVQLIFVRGEEGSDIFDTIFKNFDLGICQAGVYWGELEQKFKIVKSDLYKRNKNNRQITLTDFGKEQTGVRKQKIRERGSRIARKLGMNSNLNFNDDVHVLAQGIYNRYLNM